MTQFQQRATVRVAALDEVGYRLQCLADVGVVLLSRASGCDYVQQIKWRFPDVPIIVLLEEVTDDWPINLWTDVFVVDTRDVSACRRAAEAGFEIAQTRSPVTELLNAMERHGLQSDDVVWRFLTFVACTRKGDGGIRAFAAMAGISVRTLERRLRGSGLRSPRAILGSVLAYRAAFLAAYRQQTGKQIVQSLPIGNPAGLQRLLRNYGRTSKRGLSPAMVSGLRERLESNLFRPNELAR